MNQSYDISDISGFANVGSMVVYEKGKPKRSDYRKFRIKTVAGPDDYACMREVLMRRFTGQLGAAGRVLGIALRHKAALSGDGYHVTLGFQLGIGPLDVDENISAQYMK